MHRKSTTPTTTNKNSSHWKYLAKLAKNSPWIRRNFKLLNNFTIHVTHIFIICFVWLKLCQQKYLDCSFYQICIKWLSWEICAYMLNWTIKSMNWRFALKKAKKLNKIGVFIGFGKDILDKIFDIRWRTSP